MDTNMFNPIQFQQQNLQPNMSNQQNQNLPNLSKIQDKIFLAGDGQINPSTKEKELQNKINELKDLLKDQENQYEEKILQEKNLSKLTSDDLRKTIEELQDKYSVLQTKIYELKGENNMKQQEIYNITEEKNVIYKQNQELKEELQTVQKELERSNQQVDKEHEYFIETKYESIFLKQVINQKDKQYIQILDLLRNIIIEKERRENKKDFGIDALKDYINLFNDQLNQLRNLINEWDQQKLQQERQERKEMDYSKIEEEQKQKENLLQKQQEEEELIKEMEWRAWMRRQGMTYVIRQRPKDEVIRQKEGAMEALCRQGNFYKFEEQPDVKILKTKFQVWRVEIKDEAFNKNIETIFKIECPQDFYKNNEGTWDCIRTEKPFAFGMMKDVFLMKKLSGNSDELYVIKTPIGSKPYQTMDDALEECKSHLICQKLMKKFVDELQEKVNEKKMDLKIPSVKYSDFLILEESKNSFWIAERYFEGQFDKYNNNYGYINEDNYLELNDFAQSFTYYTFITSNFNYIICDVQGVGNYFTDPAINTHKGNFDDTDMGEEGQLMYLINFDNKKSELTKKYLDLLGIYELQIIKQNL